MKKIACFLNKLIISWFLVILSFTGILAGFLLAANAQTINSCAGSPINSPTLIKTYHLRDTTYGFGVFAAKDGGYLLTGDTIAGGGMAAPYPYIVKTNAKGETLWSKTFSSASNALGEMSARHIGRLSTETTDGNIITASDVVDFVNEDLKEFYGDILLTKLKKNGTQLWSVMLGDHSIDRPRQIWPLPGGGALLLASFMQTGYGSEITDGAPLYSVFVKLDKNGKVVFSKKMSWNATNASRLADGSFIVLANVNVTTPKQANNILGSELVPHALPTIVKLDSNLNVIWAKSLEMIPTELNAPTGYSSTSVTTAKTVIRMAGGDFRIIEEAPDGGFIAFGFGDLTLFSGLLTGGANSLTSFSPRALIAVKVNAAGKLLWAKKLVSTLVSSISSNDFKVVKTTDGNFVIMQDIIRNSEGVNTAKFSNLEVLKNAGVSSIALTKTDAELNALWTMQYDAERDAAGYSLQPTADKGVVAVGNMLTTKTHMVMGEEVPYTEAVLIKVDANGNINNCALAVSQPNAANEDQSNYITMQDMKVSGVENIKLKINKKVKEKVSTAKNIARDICKYQKSSITPNCSYSNLGATAPAANTVTKTWAQINFQSTKMATITGEKNQLINNELLPLLNEVFNNEVKIKDSEKSMWLTYVFNRLVTRADVEAVQKKYQELGYKIDESRGGTLNVSKVGLALRLTFSIQNSMAGKLEVMF